MKIFNTAFIIASSNGNIEIVKLLLEQEGIDINAKDVSSFLLNAYSNNLRFQTNIWKLFEIFETALMNASENNHIEIVKLLIELENIDINAKNICFYYILFIILI